MSSGPASTDASEAGYIVCSPILNPKAKTPLATQGESIYLARGERVRTVSNDQANIINDLTGKIDRGERPRTDADGEMCQERTRTCA